MSPPIHLITDLQMAVFLINSRLDLLCDAYVLLKKYRPHFSRSYVCILPNSLTRVLSSALDFSSYLPVSVCGTVPYNIFLDSISWHLDYTHLSDLISPLRCHYSPILTDLPISTLRLVCFDQNNHSLAGVHLMRPAIDPVRGIGL